MKFWDIWFEGTTKDFDQNMVHHKCSQDHPNASNIIMDAKQTNGRSREQWQNQAAENVPF